MAERKFVVIIWAISHEAPQSQSCDVFVFLFKSLPSSYFEINHDMIHAYSLNTKDGLFFMMWSMNSMQETMKQKQMGGMFFVINPNSRILKTRCNWGVLNQMSVCTCRLILWLHSSPCWNSIFSWTVAFMSLLLFVLCNRSQRRERSLIHEFIHRPAHSSF